MIARRLEDGRLLVPMLAESEDGTIGEALVAIDLDHPLWAVWDAHLADGE